MHVHPAGPEPLLLPATPLDAPWEVPPDVEECEPEDEDNDPLEVEEDDEEDPLEELAPPEEDDEDEEPPEQA